MYTHPSSIKHSLKETLIFPRLHCPFSISSGGQMYHSPTAPIVAPCVGSPASAQPAASLSGPLQGQGTAQRKMKGDQCNSNWPIKALLNSSHMSQVNSLRPSDTHVSKLGYHWFRKMVVTCLVPSHYLNQCWLIVNHISGKIFQWTLNQIWSISISDDSIVKKQYGNHFVSTSMC